MEGLAITMAPTYTSQADEDFFAAIGRLTISWAHLELGLDVVIQIVHLGGIGAQSKAPRHLQQKVSYLRETIKKMPLPDDAISGYESLFSAIEQAARIRHDIIHGAIIEQVEGSGRATSVRLVHQKNIPTPRKFETNTIEILKAANDAQRLSGKTLLWATELQRFISEQGNETAKQN